jgi:hypothetical protein
MDLDDHISQSSAKHGREKVNFPTSGAAPRQTPRLVAFPCGRIIAFRRWHLANSSPVLNNLLYAHTGCDE